MDRIIWGQFLFFLFSLTPSLPTLLSWLAQVLFTPVCESRPVDHSGLREKEVASGNLEAPLETLPKIDSSGWACQTHPTRGHPRLTRQDLGGCVALGKQHWQEEPCDISPPECQRKRGPQKPSSLSPSMTVQDAEAQGLSKDPQPGTSTSNLS